MIRKVNLGPGLGNESANESDSDTEGGEEVEVDENESHLDVDESRTERAVSPKVQKREIKWNREGEGKLRGAYGNGSRSTSRREQNSAWELEK